jgi:putative ABC transport system permease protein
VVALGWAVALVRRRPGRVFGAAAGVALAVALLGSLGAFLATAKSQMTTRAVRQVPVDWQVEVQQGASNADVAGAIARRPGVRASVSVGYGPATGMVATTGGTTQTTGPGVVLGLPEGYRAWFPQEIRTLVGRGDGVLLAQQAAANLHARPGDVVSVGLPGRAPVSVTIEGVVDLPAADSLFQRVGAPPGAGPEAPPDNVLLLPKARWDQFYADAASPVQAVRTQFHVRLDHHLPPDPSAAFSQAVSAGRRLEADLAGSVLVGNNLAAILDAARSDALYAQVLFIGLGLPGLLLAALLTRAVAGSGGAARRRELALLRTRGASRPQLQALVLSEAVAVGIIGAVGGLAGAAAVGRAAFGSSPFGAGRLDLGWAAVSAAAGFAITAAAVAVPAQRDASTVSVADARRALRDRSAPAALRYGLDVIMLAVGGAIVWATSRASYNLVVAPEGVPTVSVDYWALAGPLLLWGGLGLFAWRVVVQFVGRGRRVLDGLLRPIARGLHAPVAATVHRQRRAMGAGVVLLTLTVAFAVSASVFNTTYRRQVEVDSILTNGAAVTVAEAPAAQAGQADAARLAQVPGVSRVEALQHRFAYVGADLQDLYGVDPATIGSAAHLQDAYFSGGTARQLLRALSLRPDSVLVSAETVTDFQLRPGDRLRLRVRDARSGQLVDVDFHYAGIVTEFPTAPTDSFLVANARYLAERTGDPSVSTFLLSTAAGARPRAVARDVRRVAGSDATVTDIEESRRVVGSSLTAVDLNGLTKVELGYALLLAVASTGLVLALGFAQRRRAFAILAALGAKRHQIAVFASAEAAVFAVLGAVLGVAGGWVLAEVLVKVLTGVFDPPPAKLAVPGAYLLGFAACAAGGVVAAVWMQIHSLRRPLIEMVRDL